MLVWYQNHPVKPQMSRKRHLILECQIASSQIKVILSRDYALFPPISSRGKKGKKQAKKKKTQSKNALIGGGDWCETSVFYVFDFQMSAGARRLSVCHSSFLGGGVKQEGVAAGVG